MFLTRRVVVSGLLMSGVAQVSRAAAGERLALYQATTIVTGTDMRQRPVGFRRCLIEVIIKLSGNPRLEQDQTVGTLADQADRLVASFEYVDPRAGLLHHDDQGTYDRSYELTVRFDPDKVRLELARLGISIWSDKRPLLNPVVLVRDRDPTPFLLSASEPRGSEMRAAVVRSAGAMGVGVVFPTEADLAAWAVDLFGFPTPLADTPDGIARVTGSLSWSVHAMGWVGTWWMWSSGAEHRWDISGVGFDQALANLVQGTVMLVAGTATP